MLKKRGSRVWAWPWAKFRGLTVCLRISFMPIKQMFRQTSGFEQGTRDPIHILKNSKLIVWHFKEKEPLKVPGRDIMTTKILHGLIEICQKPSGEGIRGWGEIEYWQCNRKMVSDLQSLIELVKVHPLVSKRRCQSRIKRKGNDKWLFRIWLLGINGSHMLSHFDITHGICKRLSKEEHIEQLC